MKNQLFAIFAILYSSMVFSQSLTKDEIKTNKGNLVIQPVNHATMVLTWNGNTIYVDPVGGAEAFKAFKKPDIVLITDIHGDHFDLKTLEELNAPAITYVVPQAVANLLPASIKKVIILKNGYKTQILDLSIQAVPMYNLPETADAMHPKGRGNGYVIKAGNKNIYISGDTEGTPEMRSIDNIDVAFVCMNLPYTMDIYQAASAVLDFKPKIVYPYHYRGKDGFSDVQKFKELVNASNKKIDVRLLKWY